MCLRLLLSLSRRIRPEENRPGLLPDDEGRQRSGKRLDRPVLGYPNRYKWGGGTGTNNTNGWGTNRWTQSQNNLGQTPKEAGP